MADVVMKDVLEEAPAVAPVEAAVDEAKEAKEEAPEKETTEKETTEKETEKETNEKETEKETTEKETEKETTEKETTEKETTEKEATEKEATEKEATAAETEAKGKASPEKTATPKSRRKSGGGGDGKAKKLNRKASKARIVHLDAQPGDHYFVKLKGYPAWPVVVCDEAMLPETLLKTRPVTAARPDGTYREDYADGGRRAADRTFPVMYLHTNEFGWVPNTDMHDLDPAKALDAINDKMRKDLQEAHRLAAENRPLSYFKELLQQFRDEQEAAAAEAAEAAAAEAAKAAVAATPKKPAKKSSSKDVDMLDVPAGDDEDDEDDNDDKRPLAKKSKKRKAEEDVRTPQRADSAKKPKIKITSSGTPSSAVAKSTAKAKAKGASPAEAKEAPAAAPEPVYSAEEKLKRKSKEILFLRHKLQKSLLRNQEPKPEEMTLLSEYITKLEGFPQLEVSIIRETKIHKVLKAILKIHTIPREEEFQFKPRSQALLDKWNRLLAAEPAPEAAAAATAAANGTSTNGTSKETLDTAEAKTQGAKPEEAKEEGAAPAKENEKPQEEPAAVEAAA